MLGYSSDGSSDSMVPKPARLDIHVYLEEIDTGKEIEVPLSQIRIVDAASVECEQDHVPSDSSQIPLVPRLLASSWDHKETRSLFVIGNMQSQFHSTGGLTIESAFYGNPATESGKNVTTIVQYFVSNGTLDISYKYDFLFGQSTLPNPKLRILYKVRGLDSEQLVHETLKDIPVKIDAEQVALSKGVDWGKIVKSDKKSTEREEDTRATKVVTPSYPPISPGGMEHVFGRSLSKPEVSSGRVEICDLCGESHSPPITYHMRLAHPGCGKSAKSMGYNSSGTYDSGWVGNCGDGGVGGNTWYLMCEPCREKYKLNAKEKSQEEDIDEVLANPLLDVALASTSDSETQEKTDELSVVSLLNGIRKKTEFLLNLEPFEGDPRLSSVSMEYDIENDTSLDACHNSLYLSIKNRLETEVSSIVMNESYLRSNSESLARRKGRPLLMKQQTLDCDSKSIQHGKSDSPHEIPSSWQPRKSLESTTDDMDSNKSHLFNQMSSGQLSRTLSMPYPDEYRSQEAIREPIVPIQRSGKTNEANISISGTDSHNTISQTDDVPLEIFKSKFVSASPSGGLKKGKLSKDYNRQALLSRPSKQLRKFAKSDEETSLSQDVFDFLLSSAEPTHVARVLKIQAEQIYRRLQGLRLFITFLKSVKTAGAVHDLLWFFVSTMACGKAAVDVHGADVALPLGEHPLEDFTINNGLAKYVRQTFHHLMSIIMDFMKGLPRTSPTQQIALRCWALPFQQADLAFLHSSKIFLTVSEHVSLTPPSNLENRSCDQVKVLQRLPIKFSCTVSSKEALKDSLTDNDTQTFWEGDDDNQWIQLEFEPEDSAEEVALFIDNVRDENHRVGKVMIETGPSSEKRVEYGPAVTVDTKFAGWIVLPCARLSAKANAVQSPRIVRINLSQANRPRVRQVRAFGAEIPDTTIPNSHEQYIRKRAGEALQLFRELTMQVFKGGKEPTIIRKNNKDNKIDEVEEALPGVDASVSNEENKENASDIKEQVVGILFTQGQELSVIQAEVCRHFFNEVNRKTVALIEQDSCLSDTDEVYMYELLSLVSSLTVSEAGLKAITKEKNLFNHLLVLLNIGTKRVQMHSVTILKKLLEFISYDDCIHLVEPIPLPKVGFGPLPVLLITIAKCLKLQVRSRGKNRFSTTITLPEAYSRNTAVVDKRWLIGRVEDDVLPYVIMLVSSMLTSFPTYTSHSKNTLTQLISYLADIDPATKSNHQDILMDVQLWFCLAALCVVDSNTVAEMTVKSNSAARESQFLCENHDDGETIASSTCLECGMNLCSECDRVLHLRRMKRDHKRAQLGEPANLLSVELNEGCGRARLPHLLAVADRKSFKAMLEFKENTTSAVCRFCAQPLGEDGGVAQLVSTGIKNICGEAACIQLARESCTKILPCGHACCGLRDELTCLPCLHGCKPDDQTNETSTVPLTQDYEDQCMVCFTGALHEEPCVQAPCGHVFHKNCVRRMLEMRWSGPRITFGFCRCPICSQSWIHQFMPSVNDLLQPLNELYDEVSKSAMRYLGRSGLGVGY